MTVLSQALSLSLLATKHRNRHCCHQTEENLSSPLTKDIVHKRNTLTAAILSSSASSEESSSSSSSMLMLRLNPNPNNYRRICPNPKNYFESESSDDDSASDSDSDFTSKLILTKPMPNSSNPKKPAMKPTGKSSSIPVKPTRKRPAETQQNGEDSRGKKSKTSNKEVELRKKQRQWLH
ncbi:hypothetical protein LguiA_016885 [Lonicera macranthoides]